MVARVRRGTKSKISRRRCEKFGRNVDFLSGFLRVHVIWSTNLCSAGSGEEAAVLALCPRGILKCRRDKAFDRKRIDGWAWRLVELKMTWLLLVARIQEVRGCSSIAGLNIDRDSGVVREYACIGWFLKFYCRGSHEGCKQISVIIFLTGIFIIIAFHVLH